MDVLQSLLPIVLALAGGFAVGRFLPEKIGSALVRCILPLVWLLLFLIGAEFGEVILSAQSVGQVIRSAAVFAVLTTLLPAALIFAAKVRGAGAREGRSGGTHLQAIWAPLKECCLALSMVVLGSLFFLANATFMDGAFPLPSSSAVLMALIALVGIDLARVKLSARWFSWRVLMAPGLVVVGSFAGAMAASLLTGATMRTSMALSSGFGWFTLSGVMVGNHLGQTYGTMALMIDLFRELLAIIALYMLGRYYPAVGIGSAGATALDSTLPIVKQACHPDAVPMALVSGFVLTILAPVFMAFFLS